MIKVPEGLIKQTKIILRIYYFLKCECGLKETDRLSLKDLKSLLGKLKI